MAKKSSKKLQPLEIPTRRDLSEDEQLQIFDILRTRFAENSSRHEGLDWSEIQVKLEKNPDKLWSVYLMEQTGGEPDVVSYDTEADEYLFFDCSEQSPAERRSICYDRNGQDKREKKGVYPRGNAIDIADAMGIEILTEKQYRHLQELGDFDTKTSSWVETPTTIRKLGGAIFCDRRYDTVFTYHNSAHSFYSARGFRGSIRV